MTTPKTTAHVFISGRVQGVSFRYWTVTQAQSRLLTGWGRNLRDGRVEALFHGQKEAVDDMVAACYKGPVLARVSDVTATEGDYDGSETFEQKPTI